MTARMAAITSVMTVVSARSRNRGSKRFISGMCTLYNKVTPSRQFLESENSGLDWWTCEYGGRGLDAGIGPSFVAKGERRVELGGRKGGGRVRLSRISSLPG